MLASSRFRPLAPLGAGRHGVKAFAGAVASERGRSSALQKRDKAVLPAGVAVDVAFRRLDRPVTRKQLDVAQTAAGAVNVASRRRDEGAPPRMRRAAGKS